MCGYNRWFVLPSSTVLQAKNQWLLLKSGFRIATWKLILGLPLKVQVCNQKIEGGGGKLLVQRTVM